MLKPLMRILGIILLPFWVIIGFSIIKIDNHLNKLIK